VAQTKADAKADTPPEKALSQREREEDKQFRRRIETTRRAGSLLTIPSNLRR
jgi:hypothetical protein